MLSEYSNRTLAMDVNNLTDRYDLHYQDATSDRVYIVTIEEVESNKGHTMHTVISNWARRGGALQSKVAGTHESYAYALTIAQDLIDKKTKKGYKHVGRYARQDKKGLLSEIALCAIEERYSVGAKLLSPTGTIAYVAGLTERGDLIVSPSGQDDDLITIPFGQYGMMKVIN